MRNGSDNDDRRLATSTDIVDIVPPGVDNDTISKVDDISAGTTKLSDEDLHNLFQHRNLAYLATLSKDGSPHVTPVWAELVDDLILINTFESSVKNKNITNDKRTVSRENGLSLPSL
jgi:hypothetical protein